MSSNPFGSTSNRRIYTPLIFAIALFLAVFLARPLFGQYSDASNEKESLSHQQATLKEQLETYKKDEEALNKPENAQWQKTITNIAKPFSSTDIIEALMLNSYTAAKTGASPLMITNVSVDKGTKLPSGIWRGTVQLNLSAYSIDVIIKYLDYLTQNSDYAFTLDAINLPLNAGSVQEKEQASNENMTTLSVNLGIYYSR